MRLHLAPLLLWTLPACMAAAPMADSAESGTCSEADLDVPAELRGTRCVAVHSTLKQDSSDPRCLRDPERQDRCFPNPDGCQEVVVTQQGTQVLQTCTLASGDTVSRPGTLVVAHCTEHQDANGAACRVCASAAGDVVSDSCHHAPVEGDLRCETLEPPAGGACQVCTPSRGGDVVLRRRCVPAGVDPTRCTPVEDPARGACVECRDAHGTLVSATCEPAPAATATRHCRRIILEAAAGLPPQVCHLCLDSKNRVTEYACAPDDPDAAPVCQSFMDAGGAACTVCQDGRTGLELSRRCTEAPEPAVLCATLADFVGGPRCEVCQDSEGRLVSRRCAPAGCVPGALRGACTAEAPQCALRESAISGVCDRCGDVTGDGRVDESDWRCTTVPTPFLSLACALEPDAAGGGRCRVCRDADGRELSRSCDAQGAAPGAQCGALSLPGGTVCSLCTDALGSVVDNGCDTALACTQETLARADGTQATCSRCTEGITTCTRDEDCGTGQACGLNGCFFPTELENRDHLRRLSCWEAGATACSMGSTGSSACQASAGLWMVTLPGVCGNAWETWWQQRGGPLPVDAGAQGEVLRQWLQETQGITVLGHRLEMAAAPTPPAECRGCGCPRGEALAVLAPAVATLPLLQLGFVLAP